MTHAQIYRETIRDVKAKAKRDAQRKAGKRERETLRTFKRDMRLSALLSDA